MFFAYENGFICGALIIAWVIVWLLTREDLRQSELNTQSRLYLLGRILLTTGLVYAGCFGLLNRLLDDSQRWLTIIFAAKIIIPFCVAIWFPIWMLNNTANFGSTPPRRPMHHDAE